MTRLTWTLRIAAVATLLLALAAVVVASPQAHLLTGRCDSLPGPASTEGVWADTARIYVARADGHVDAVDRGDGRLVWSWPSTFQPDAGIRSIVADDVRVYIAIGEVTNKADDPVIALDKATGQEVWRTASLRLRPGLAPADPFRLALHKTDASDPYLYVGMNGGDVLKLDRATGIPLSDGLGGIRHFHPPENADSVDPNGIYALEVSEGFVYAARDWGNLSRSAPVDLFNANNTLLHLRTDLTPASGDGELVMTQGNAERSDAIFALWHDAANNRLYAAGAAPRGSRDSFRIEAVVHQLDLATATTPTASKFASDVGLRQTHGDGTSSYVASVLSMGGDANNVYLGTQPDGSLDGYVLRLNKDLSNTTGWPNRSSFGAGGVRALQVLDGALVLGHACSEDQERLAGALVLEVPKVRVPAAVLHKPQDGTLSNGRIDVVLRTIPLSSAPYDVSFFLQRPDGSVVRFEDLGVTLLGQHFTPDATLPTSWRGVRFPAATVPDGPGYRIRADISTSGGSFRDWSEGSFAIDRRAPDILDLSPAPGSTVTSDTQRVTVALRDLDLDGDVGSLVDAAASSLRLNGVPVQGVTYEANGLSFDVGSGPNLPLRQGLNDFHAEIRDRAGNLATRSWTLRLDHEVDAPSFVPDGGFVNERRPILRATVPETATLVQAVFNGTDVTSLVTRTAGTDGATNFQFRPSGELSQAFTYEWRLVLRDAIGNQNPEPFRLVFRVDEARPEVHALEPLPGQLLIDDRPKIRFSISDAGSGLQSKSVNLYVDGADRTRELSIERDTFTLVLAAPLLPGEHRATATAADVAGNLETFEWSFRVDLDSPKVKVDLLLPIDQEALKLADKVIVRVTAVDDSTVRSVRLDARSLDPLRGPQELMAPVPGRPGIYEANVTVKETRTLMARIAVAVDDHTGHQGLASADVRVDNNAPITVLDELPDFVGGSFELRWRNEPKDEAVGGSGVAFYRVEQQVGNQEWRTIRPRLTASTLVLDVPEGAFRDLHYRVLAVDKAGNVQRVPSNAVETVSRGDPFTDVRLPEAIVPGRHVTLSATAVDDLDLDNGLAFLSLTGTQGTNVTRALESYGRMYTMSWNFTGVPAGDYVARLHFRASDGFELSSASRTLHISEASASELAKASKDTPLPPVSGLVAVASAYLAIALRRRRA